ncbi:MAG: 1-deoxy-D-xylulose-5-phosphate reductoisomerase [Spirochaetaceae bacterium]|jgi:1-deoxy-D-xylulose-5-phosphate reductoisomerase|nr:1-deoxy-D-xylulose-5-phosphate reductoisomerase [Spirochaetaceae bacterium]
MKKRIAVLGATGSIGKSTIDILRQGRDDFEVVLLSAHENIRGLLALLREFPTARLALSGSVPPEGTVRTEVAYYGARALLTAIAESGAEVVVNGIAGAAGLPPSLAALEAGADLALANKETIVMAAPLVFSLAERKKKRILPVDSEHSAVFKLMEAHGKAGLDRILLTASGGPFRTFPVEQLQTITPQEALAHPTWNMGPKITVDSATLANKGLEVIEAAGLFGLKPEQISVVIHPQSVVHSMVVLRDGGVYAQMSKPDMRLPIHSALYWPECRPCSFGALSFDGLTLEFDKPDYEKFPLLPLAYDAVRAGGLYPAVYNAANEAAVAAFLLKKIGFLDISAVVEYVFKEDWKNPVSSGTLPDLETILEADKQARERALNYINGMMEKK